MGVITAEGLSRHYGRRIGIESVRLDVPEACIFGFLGPNGAGKTTTIRVLLGLLRPSAGRAAVLGKDCWRESHVLKREVGYLPGDLRLYPWMTGHSALAVVGQVRGRDLRRSGAALAERFHLDLSVRVRKMSRGMRQKLGLILALAHMPRVLILDEPTSGLDPLMRDALGDHLRNLAAKGHTVFFSSHTLSEVEQLCDRIAIVRDGRIVVDEALQSLRQRARRAVTLLFEDADHAGRIESPGFLDVQQRGGRQWQCALDGPVPDLLRWAAAQPLEDLTIGPPDLETVFRGYYRAEDEGREVDP